MESLKQKSTLSETNKLLNKLNSIMEVAEGKVIKFKGRSIEIIQSKKK